MPTTRAIPTPAETGRPGTAPPKPSKLAIRSPRAKPRAEPALARPTLPLGWDTTHADEAGRQRWRGRTEVLSVAARDVDQGLSGQPDKLVQLPPGSGPARAA